MNESELNVNEIVKVESLGVIKEQLNKVETFIDEKAKDIPKKLKDFNKLTDEQKEEQKQDIKKYGQYLNKIKNELENKRKEIKKEIEKPYEEYNNYYSNGVLVKLDNAINQIKETVEQIEIKQKQDKESELREFAQEYIDDNKLNDIITFEKIGLNVTISASIKSLKEQVLEFINKVVNDLKLIEMEEYKDEISIEYIQTLDFVDAKTKVIERHKQLEELKKQQEEKLEQEKQEEIVVEKVEEVVAPKEIIEDSEIVKVSFTLTGAKEQIKKVKDLIVELGIEYE